MKKQLLLLATVLFLSTWIFAQATTPKPIPSFNAPVTSVSTFVELISSNPGFTDGKRTIKIKDRSSSTDFEGSSRVWFFSLDQSTVLGPFQLSYRDIIAQEIDDRPWGVMIQTESPIFVDVWIYSEEMSPALGIAQ